MYSLSEKTSARIMAGLVKHLGFIPNHSPVPSNRMLNVDELKARAATLDDFSVFMHSPECQPHSKAKGRSTSGLALALSEEAEIDG